MGVQIFFGDDGFVLARHHLFFIEQQLNSELGCLVWLQVYRLWMSDFKYLYYCPVYLTVCSPNMSVTCIFYDKLFHASPGSTMFNKRWGYWQKTSKSSKSLTSFMVPKRWCNLNFLFPSVRHQISAEQCVFWQRKRGTRNTGEAKFY